MRRVRVEASASQREDGAEARSAAAQTSERRGRGERDMSVSAAVDDLTRDDIACLVSFAVQFFQPKS